jgi:tRNA modification GTPase
VSGLQFSTADTVTAIATPPGRGGIGIVRLSGPDAHRIGCAVAGRVEPFTPRYATLVTIRSGEPAPAVPGFSGTSPAADVAEPIDQALVTYFQAPSSYTGEDVVEISAHGSPVVLRQILEATVRYGARVAARGEFTLRAFLNGRIDLAQAEAVADLIDAATPLQARAAFDQLNGTLTQRVAAIDRALFDLIARLEASVDFPEEGYHFVDPAEVTEAVDAVRVCIERLLRDARRGRLIREGFQLAIVGPPNVGKSSLFNALVGSARAIVTEVPGTTRDLITETVDLGGLRVTLVDTAGVRETADAIEAQGVSRSRGAIAVADLVLVVADRSRPADDAWQLAATLGTDRASVLVANKSDLEPVWSRPDAVDVSSMTGHGIDDLRRKITSTLHAADVNERPEITNVRHIALVAHAHEALMRARHAALADGVSMSEEFVLADLQDARAALEEITGRRTSDDLLAHVFERFCVGK